MAGATSYIPWVLWGIYCTCIMFCADMGVGDGPGLPGTAGAGLCGAGLLGTPGGGPGACLC